jgi:hypothetical protein
MIMLLLNSEVYTPQKNARESESAKWIVRACLDGQELSLSEEAGSCLGETFRPAPAVGTVQLGKQRSREFLPTGYAHAATGYTWLHRVPLTRMMEYRVKPEQ